MASRTINNTITEYDNEVFHFRLRARNHKEVHRLQPILVRWLL